MQNLQARRRQELPIVPVILNLSRRDFLVSDPIGVLNHLTKKYQLPHIYFQIEITETAFVEDEDVITEAIYSCARTDIPSRSTTLAKATPRSQRCSAVPSTRSALRAFSLRISPRTHACS